MTLRASAPARRPRASPLRRKLEALLALSLAAPVSACGTSGDAGGPDGSFARDTGAGPEASLADAGRPDDGSACSSVPVEPSLFGEDGSCGRFVYLPCGVPPELRGVGCNPSADLCAVACPQGAFFICDFPAPSCEDGGLVPDAAVYLDCTTCLGNVGRRPAGLRLPREETGHLPRRTVPVPPLAAFFARTAYLEAASVAAFRQLAAELTTFGAPARLCRAAERAARDEVRHARVTSRFARKHGARVPALQLPPPRSTTLCGLALENAVEGCVRETYGALVALHQAARATDPGVARAMRAIADDEVRHAELAWAIDRWIGPRLAPRVRRRIRAAQRTALSELARTSGGWHPSVVRDAGIPPRVVELQLVRNFGQALLG